jgi:hypothetical protein
LCAAAETTISGVRRVQRVSKISDAHASLFARYEALSEDTIIGLRAVKVWRK